MARSLVPLAGLIEMALVITEGIFHPPQLPLGGSHCAQIGICLGVAFILDELIAKLLGSTDTE